MHSRRARAFTLIELLVVLVIIAVLVSIVIVVASGVQSSARTRATTDVLRQVEVGVETYITETGGELPPAIVLGPNPDVSMDDEVAYPLADAIDESGGDERTINSIGLFIVAAERQGLTSLFAGLPDGQLMLFDADEDDGGRQPELRTIFDSWGQPVRFVHPAFDGVVTQEMVEGLDAGAPAQDGTALSLVDFSINESNPQGAAWSFFAISAGQFPEQVRLPNGGVNPLLSPITMIRRNASEDSDGGVCINGRPYAYSVGEDGDASTVEDSNVYLSTPRFLVSSP